MDASYCWQCQQLALPPQPLFLRHFAHYEQQRGPVLALGGRKSSDPEPPVRDGVPWEDNHFELFSCVWSTVIGPLVLRFFVVWLVGWLVGRPVGRSVGWWLLATASLSVAWLLHLKNFHLRNVRCFGNLAGQHHLAFS